MNTHLQTVYTCISTYISQYGYPPNVAEIAAACSLHAGTVRFCLDRLEARRRITRLPGKERSIRLGVSLPALTLHY